MGHIEVVKEKDMVIYGGGKAGGKNFARMAQMIMGMPISIEQKKGMLEDLKWSNKL